MRRALAAVSNLEHSFRRAEQTHRQVDSRLRELGRRAYLTPGEQREVLDLKKLRLQVKDEMLRVHPDAFG